MMMIIKIIIMTMTMTTIMAVMMMVMRGYGNDDDNDGSSDNKTNIITMRMTGQRSDNSDDTVDDGSDDNCDNDDGNSGDKKSVCWVLYSVITQKHHTPAESPVLPRTDKNIEHVQGVISERRSNPRSIQLHTTAVRKVGGIIFLIYARCNAL